jgi:solute carrier family 50 protein (sugar transporter)
MAATSVLASLGTAAGIAMALSPLPTIRSIVRSRTTGDFSVFPYVATLCQCSLWIAYATATPGKTALIPVNALVATLELSYCIIFVLYASEKSAIVRSIAYPSVATGAAIVLSIVSASASKFLGFFAVLSNIIMYAAPLTIVKTVIETKSVKYMPLLLSLVGTISAVIWTSWAISAGDSFVLIPNVLGFILGCIQLIVYYKYRTEPAAAPDAVANAMNSPDMETGVSRIPKAGETTSLIRSSN